jgi:cytochrome b561
MQAVTSRESSAESTRYGAVSQALHWITVGLVIVLLLTGKVGDVETDEPGSALFVWHGSLGVLVLVLTLLRILWTLVARAPAPLPGQSPFNRAVARGMHAALYALLVALPLSGWLAASAGGASVNFFWTATLPRWDVAGGVTSSKPTAPVADVRDDDESAGAAAAKGKERDEAFEEIHEFLGNALLILASLHVLAALKHQFMDRDGLMMRMLPRGAGRAAPPP